MATDLKSFLASTQEAPDGIAWELYRLQPDDTYAQRVSVVNTGETPLSVTVTNPSSGSSGPVTLASVQPTLPVAIQQQATDNPIRVTLEGAGLYSVATPTSDGLMSATDKIKLNALSTSAFNGTVGATTPSTGVFTTVSATGDVSFPRRRRGFVVANNVSAQTTGTYNIDPIGFDGFASGTVDSLSRIYLMNVLSMAPNHQIQGVALYTNDWNGQPILLQTLGKREVGGTLTFTVVGNSPRAVITNTIGNVPTYSCQIVCLN